MGPMQQPEADSSQAGWRAPTLVRPCSLLLPVHKYSYRYLPYNLLFVPDFQTSTLASF